MRNWKSDYFRPQILDQSKDLRKRFEIALKESEMSREAFNRKFAEGGLAAVKKLRRVNLNALESRRGDQ